MAAQPSEMRRLFTPPFQPAILPVLGPTPRRFLLLPKSIVCHFGCIQETEMRKGNPNTCSISA